MTLEIMSYLAPFKTRLAKSMKARENLWWNKGTTAHRTLGVGTCECSTPEGRRRKTYNQKISCSSADRVWNKILFGNSVVRNIIWIDYRSTINSVTIEKIENWKRIILIIIYTWYVIQRRSTILVKIFNLL